ncbi:MAG: acylphosphatase [Desulfuromonas sp.]|nr:MAG: acylphosphatase [Desulfuromonas sp.]
MEVKIMRARVHVSGRVQGVWFRQSTKNKAEEHNVTGWTRNNIDGTVEALFEGEEVDIRTLIDWCRQGPETARVDSLHVIWEIPTGEFTTFQIK